MGIIFNIKSSKIFEFVYSLIPDKMFLKIKYRIRMRKRLNLKNPQTFNEKLQWLKLYDRKDIYTTMVDKYEAKKYVSDIIGEEYIIPTLGIYNSFKEIDFEKLPEKFVIKCTHDSGGLIICKDKENFDIVKAKKKINKCLKRKYYYFSREWPYKNVKPRIIVEKYMEDEATKELPDYKFFTFNGDPKILFIASDRQSEKEETKFDFFDMDFNHLKIENGHSNATTIPEKPEMFETMKELAKKLSKGIPHLRVDFYQVNGKIYFGELTFYHWSGLVPFKPEEYDYKLGEMLKIDNI